MLPHWRVMPRAPNTNTPLGHLNGLRANHGQVFFGLVEPRVRVGVVQDHQR